MSNAPKTIRELRRLLVNDSVERGRWLGQLVLLVRQEERQKVIATMTHAREARERGEA